MKCLVLLASLALLTACADSSAPALELTLFDQAVSCEADGCRPGGPLGEEHRVRVLLGRSSFGPAGRRLQAWLRRPGDVRAVLELDLPPAAAVEAPRLLYTETDPRGQLLFSAARAWGRVELSRDESCPCQTGRLELRLFDPGPDGVLDTADDRVRQVSQARLRRGPRPFCHARAALPIRPGLLVVGERACPVRGRPGSSAPCASAWGAAGQQVGGWDEDGWYDVGWTGEWSEGWDDGWDDATVEPAPVESGSSPAGEGWSDEGWTDEGWSDEGWSDEGWSDEGWSDEGWSDEDQTDQSGTDDEWGGDDWGNDDWGGDEWGGDDGGSDDDSDDDWL